MSEQKVEIRALNRKNILVTIKGLTPLLMEKMDMDVVESLNKKKAEKIVKDDKRLEEDKIEQKIHFTQDGNVGFPASGFSRGMVGVAPYFDGLDMKKVKGSVRVNGDIIPIDFKDRHINITWGRQSGISKAPRKIVRPEFKDWSCVLNISYNADNISAEQIVNLLNWAGFHMGIGSWRPEKGGIYGQYEVVPTMKEKVQ